MRAYLLAATAIVTLTMTGCTALTGPSSKDLNRCVEVAAAPLGRSLSDLSKAFEAAGSTVRWRSGDAGKAYLIASRADPLTSTRNELGLELDLSDGSTQQSHCGPGLATVVRATANGQAVNIFAAESVIFEVLEKYIGHPLTDPDPPSGAASASQPASPPLAPAVAPPQNSTAIAGDDLGDEASMIKLIMPPEPAKPKRSKS